MRPITIKLFALIICLTLVKFAAAQDYVVTVKHDTLPAKIKFPFFGGAAKYQTADMPEMEPITTDKVLKFYVANGNILRSVVYKEGKTVPEYLELLQEGKINLYVESYYVNGSTITEYYLSKGSDTAKRIKSTKIFVKDHKVEFANMINDNPAVYERFIADDKFSLKQIYNLVHWYNTGEPMKR